MFVCPMPDLTTYTGVEKMEDHNRQKRDMNRYHLNACEWYLEYNPQSDFINTNVTENDITSGNIKVNLIFIMDGAPRWTNATFSITLHQNPTLEENPQRVDDYVPVWPCTHDHISIKGKNLLVGLRESDYQVMIGNKLCDDMAVTMTEITCLPPVGEPRGIESSSENTKVEVIVGTGCLPGYVYNLAYHRNIFDCGVTLVYLGGAIGCLVVGLTVIIICVIFCRCKRSDGRNSGRSPKEIHYISPGSVHSEAGYGNGINTLNPSYNEEEESQLSLKRDSYVRPK